MSPGRIADGLSQPVTDPNATATAPAQPIHRMRPSPEAGCDADTVAPMGLERCDVTTAGGVLTPEL